MGNAYWFYNRYGNDSELKRVLLLQKTEDKEDAKIEDIRKSYRGLGVTACAQLQAKKSSDVEILVSDKVADDKMLGIFENSLALSNYEFVFKRPHQEEAKDGEDKEPKIDEDDRSKRVTKHIENITLTVENHDEIYNSDSSVFQRASAGASILARDLANTRGSVGTPCFMEEKMVGVAKGHDLVKEIRILDAQQLQDLGMNLFYNVGKAATSQPRCVMVHY